MSGVRTVSRTPILIVVPQPAPTRTEGRRVRVRNPECHPGGRIFRFLPRLPRPRVRCLPMSARRVNFRELPSFP